MLKTKIFVNGFGFVARSEYIYRYDSREDKVLKYKMSEEEKRLVREFEEDAYDDGRTSYFLNSIWKIHDHMYGECLLPARLMDYWGR